MRKILFSLLLITYSCAPTRFVKPLDKNQHAVTASFGGALTNVPGVAVIPIPNTSFGYGFGATNTTTLYGSWYSTAAMFGVFQMDVGITQLVWKDTVKHMGVTVSPGINFMVDVFEKNARTWPQLDANYYFDYRLSQAKKRNGRDQWRTNTLYLGMANWIELQSTRAHEVDQANRVIFSPQIGHIYERNNWSFSTELKFLAPYAKNTEIVVDYLSAFKGRGALGFYMGLSYKF